MVNSLWNIFLLLFRNCQKCRLGSIFHVSYLLLSSANKLENDRFIGFVAWKDRIIEFCDHFPVLKKFISWSHKPALTGNFD